MIYVILGLASGFYAAWLNSPKGRRFAITRTAESTILGTSLVLFFCLFLIPPRLWVRVALAFSVAGAPMIGRSLWNRVNKEADLPTFG